MEDDNISKRFISGLNKYNLTIDDIMCKPKALSGVTVKDKKGNEVTRTEPREKCYCEHCSHD